MENHHQVLDEHDEEVSEVWTPTEVGESMGSSVCSEEGGIPAGGWIAWHAE